MQWVEHAALQKTTRDAINTKLRKEGNITINIANLADQLDAPEIAALKALAVKGKKNALLVYELLGLPRDAGGRGRHLEADLRRVPPCPRDRASSWTRPASRPPARRPPMA